jgi:hypothetical protein
VDEAFAIRRALVTPDGFAVEIQLHNVGGRYLRRRDRSRDQVSACAGRGADADMAERVDNLLRGQDMIRGHHIVDE